MSQGRLLILYYFYQFYLAPPQPRLIQEATTIVMHRHCILISAGSRAEETRLSQATRGKEPSPGRRLPASKMRSSGLRRPVIPDSAGLRKLPMGFASASVRGSPTGSFLRLHAMSGF
jgi:hypothetical protein